MDGRRGAYPEQNTKEQSFENFLHSILIYYDALESFYSILRKKQGV